MYKELYRQAWVEIDLSAFDHNIRTIREHLGDEIEMIGVIKADAYGHGVVECAQVLAAEGITRFAVATIDEALELREEGSDEDIIILGLIPDSCADVIVENDLTAVVGSIDTAKALAEAAGEGRAKMLFAIDTGMGRIGYRTMCEEELDAAADAYEAILAMDNISIEGIITHFSTADEEQREYTEAQIERYNSFCSKLADRGITDICRIAANSAAIMVHPDAHFEAARPGIILYGCYPSPYLIGKAIELEPVMSVKAEIVNIKTVPAGTSVSYGRKFTSEKETIIATLPLGYADGYKRSLSGKVEVLIDGKRVPVIGNICMDQCMIDVTDIADAKVGTEVTIMGRSGDDAVTADELAGLIGTINYEITCGFGQRLPKLFVNCPEAVMELAE
ncbi:MAG: alanine racemase [Clostridiales bacterium]|nr:alanine racemase [Candidatus Crickella merdequi]